jgi:hypothetical protein
MIRQTMNEHLNAAWLPIGRGQHAVKHSDGESASGIHQRDSDINR